MSCPRYWPARSTRESWRGGRFDPLGILDVLGAEQGQWTERPATSLTVTATRPLITFDECEAFATAIHSAVRRTLPGETRLLLTGRLAFTAEISTQMRREMRLMIVVATVLVSAAFWAFYRTLTPLGVALSPLSLLCVPLLIGLCIDYSLHVLMALEHERDYGHLYAHIGVPILLTGLASCIGFGVPMLTSQPVLQNFGLVMDLGIIAAVACLFLLPVLARPLRNPVGNRRSHRASHASGRCEPARRVPGEHRPRAAPPTIHGHRVGGGRGVARPGVHRGRSRPSPLLRRSGRPIRTRLP